MEAEAELTLDEILAEPIVHLMMQREGVKEADVRALLGHVAWRPRSDELLSLPVWAQGVDDLESDVTLRQEDYPPATGEWRPI